MTKLRPIAPMLVVIFLAACGGFSPQGVRNAKQTVDFKSSLGATALARCMAKNAEQYRTTMGGSFTSNLRPGAAPGGWELIVSTNGSSYAAAVSDVAPMPGGGSFATIYQHPELFGLLPKAMQEGCER